MPAQALVEQVEGLGFDSTSREHAAAWRSAVVRFGHDADDVRAAARDLIDGIFRRDSGTAFAGSWLPPEYLQNLQRGPGIPLAAHRSRCKPCTALPKQPGTGCLVCGAASGPAPPPTKCCCACLGRCRRLTSVAAAAHGMRSLQREGADHDAALAEHVGGKLGDIVDHFARDVRRPHRLDLPLSMDPTPHSSSTSWPEPLSIPISAPEPRSAPASLPEPRSAPASLPEPCSRPPVAPGRRGCRLMCSAPSQVASARAAFEAGRASPAVPPGVPPVAGALRWARALLRPLQRDMATLAVAPDLTATDSGEKAAASFMGTRSQTMISPPDLGPAAQQVHMR